MPALRGLAASAQGTQPGVDVAAARPADGAFAVAIEGFLVVPRDGEYHFTLGTDTGAVLRLHEALLIDADFGAAGGGKHEATVRLRAGLHPLRVTTRHRSGSEAALSLEWSGPDLPRSPISPDALRH